MRNKNARIPDPNKIFSPSGDVFHVEYGPEVQKDGSVIVKPTGSKTNIKEYINSFKDQTDMAYILKQMALGDSSVLTDRKPMFGDFTDAPSSLMEYHQRMLDGQRAFESLPLEVRNEYDHSLMKFMADVGSEKWMSVMKDFLPHDEVVESEVNSEDA